MTANQIAYSQLAEDVRHNKANEVETARHNQALEDVAKKENKLKQLALGLDIATKSIDTLTGGIASSIGAAAKVTANALTERKLSQDFLATQQLHQRESTRISNEYNLGLMQNVNQMIRMQNDYNLGVGQLALSIGNLNETKRANLVREEQAWVASEQKSKEIDAKRQEAATANKKMRNDFYIAQLDRSLEETRLQQKNRELDIREHEIEASKSNTRTTATGRAIGSFISGVAAGLIRTLLVSPK